MAGTINIALQQQVDVNGVPMSGALLYTFAVNTVATIQNTFEDVGLTIQNPWPLPTDAYGRIPMFYLADGFVHARLTDPTGVVLFDYPSMQVTGPSSGGGGGGGGSVDPTTVLSTGDIKFRATSETLTGWVKVNGQTIGSATSGATERANADTQALFIYLWNNFTNAHCPVSGGRGSSGLTDFQANKAIGLPDLRARVPTGLDDMGNTAAGLIQASNVTSGGGDGPTTPGAFGGETNHVLVLAEAPAGQFTLNDPGHVHTVETNGNPPTGATVASPTNGTAEPVNFNTGSSLTGITLTDHGGGGAHNTMQPFLLGSFYMKL
jgi:microcystin-dependent protein